jgi:ATP-dependent Clp protease ATP-binding subunit ClpX
LVEGTVCRVSQSGKRKHPGQEMIEIDTTNILFIAGGAYVGLNEIVSKRMDGNSIGFSSKLKLKEDIDYLEKIIPDDLTKFGMIPEFTGRFTSLVNISELNKEQLIRIMTNVKNNYIQQYEYLLSLDDIALTFTCESIDQIAENCLKLKTGARGLHSEVERVLLPHMYDVQSYIKNNIKAINITRDLVDEPRILIENTNESNN